MGFFRSRKPKADDRWASGAFAETSGDGGIGETSLTVAVRSRPLLPDERKRGDRRDIVRVLDDKHIVVLDPDDEKNYLDERTHRTKERRYTFDVALGSSASNRDVYQKTARALISGVLNGQNGTVFAYGATGSGKTYTMIGTRNDPGMMPLSLMDIFDAIRSMSGEYTFEVTCSYLEVYNELIYDLLVNNSPSLDLREDPERGATVSGLRRISVTNADNVLDVLREGNARRKTEPTEANAVSSRSHAVMEINVRRFSRVHPNDAAGGGAGGSGGSGGGGGGRMEVLTGRLSLVDLAGSERASETKNEGSKLRDGANINRSLLALANCINALGKKQQGAGVYVPFRNSKLTRLLKDGLVGNSRTAMVANVSCGNDQYNHTINTLKYADRAKEIKTNVQTNVLHVATHPGEAQRVIEQLRDEVAGLRRELKAARSGGGAPRLSFFGGGKTKTGAAQPANRQAGDHHQQQQPPSTGPYDAPAIENSAPATTALAAAEGPNEGNAVSTNAVSTTASAIDGAAGADADVFDDRWLEKLSVDVHENTEERINLQRALFELEDVAIQSRCELASVEDRLVELEMTGLITREHKSEAESLRDRRRRLAESLREGENAARRDRAAMDANEGKRREIQSRIDAAASSPAGARGGSRKLPAFLRILSQYRTRGVSSMEAHFQLAVRDGVLADQRDVIGCMWRMLGACGVSRERALEAAKREGVFAAYDGEGELNLGEDGGWSTYSLERETVVGARAAARLAFWQSYGAVDDLSVGTGKHPHVPAPASEHHHLQQHQQHHQHQQSNQHQSNHQHHVQGGQHHPRDHQPKRGGADPDPTAALLAAAAATLAKSPRAAVSENAPAHAPTQLSPRDRSARAIAKLRDRGGSGRRRSAESIQYSEGSRPVSSSGVSAQVSDSAYSGQTSRNLSARGDVQVGAGERSIGSVGGGVQTNVHTAYARVDKEEEVRAGFIPTQGKRGAPPIAASAYKTLAVGGTRASLGSRPASGGGGGGGGGGGSGRRLAGRLRSPPQPTERAFGMADAGPKPETPVAYVMRP